MGSAVRMGRRKGHPGFVNAPGVSITPSPAAAVGAVVGRCLPGLSGNIWAVVAAVAPAGEEIAAAHADGRPHPAYRRIDRIAQFR